MYTNGAELTMNRDNISTLAMAITVVLVSVITSSIICFNNPSLNQAWSVQQQQHQKKVVGGGSSSWW